MSADTLKTSGDAMFALLHQHKIDEFNERKAGGEHFELRGFDFHRVDLRDVDVKGIDFTDSYFQHADLRGLDLRTCCLEGASIHDALIAGTYFPGELSAEEIQLSVRHGTRMRYRKR